MENIQIKANQLPFEQIGWKYYKKIKKKAMEQEFSWSGLLVSLSIAFFIVIFTAFCLNFLYNTVKSAHAKEQIELEKMYMLENEGMYLQVDAIDEERFKNIRSAYFV